MSNKYTETLSRFKKLIENDNRRNSKEENIENIRDFLEWYIYNCPSNKGPETSKKFIDYGLKTPHDYKKLKSRIVDNIGLKKDTSYIYCTQGLEKENSTIIDAIEKNLSSDITPLIYFSKGEHEQIDSLYIRIRNAFAHGNFFLIKNTNFYCLWNEINKKNKPTQLGAFMILNYSHLKFIYNVLDKFSTNP